MLCWGGNPQEPTRIWLSEAQVGRKFDILNVPRVGNLTQLPSWKVERTWVVHPRGGNLTHIGDSRVGKLTLQNLKMSYFPVDCSHPTSWGKPLTGHESPIALKINTVVHVINHVIFYQKMCLSNNLQKFCVSTPYHLKNFLFTWTFFRNSSFHRTLTPPKGDVGGYPIPQLP